MPKSFDDFAKKYKKAEKVVPSIFEKVAKKTGFFFVKQAKKRTNEEGLVDTGAYKRNWYADLAQRGKFWIIICKNAMNYASHLEFGHRLRNGKRWKGRFVGTNSVKEAREYAQKELKHELGSLYKE